MSDAGWYADPFGAPGQRWWDGRAWTEQTWPPVQVAVAPAEPASPRGWYDDPDHPGAVRWWDGRAWTDRIALVPVQRGPASEIGRGRPTLVAVVALAAALVLGVALVVLP